MSRKTYVEAIEYVLDTELDARSDLICFRPGARRALEEADRDVPLPRMGKKSFSVALGAALYGMHPVLDLRQESGAAQLLKEALDDLPVGMTPVMTVIACAEDREMIAELPNAYVLEPKSPRQAAGFMRSALKLQRLTVVLADQALFAEEDDVPEERTFTMLPLDPAEKDEMGEPEDQGEEKAAPSDSYGYQAAGEDRRPAVEASEFMDEEAVYDEAGAEKPWVIAPEEINEEAAYRQAEAEPVRVVVPSLTDDEADETGGQSGRQEKEKMPAVYLAARQTRCDLSALRALCALLDMDEEALVECCAGHVLPVCGGFELHCEMDAPEGEAAFIPPVEENASIWLGSDMLTISYDASLTPHTDAAKLLHAVKRVLEKPQLLIYDKEYDEA